LKAIGTAKLEKNKKYESGKHSLYSIVFDRGCDEVLKEAPTELLPNTSMRFLTTVLHPTRI